MIAAPRLYTKIRVFNLPNDRCCEHVLTRGNRRIIATQNKHHLLKGHKLLKRVYFKYLIVGAPVGVLKDVQTVSSGAEALIAQRT